MGVPRGRLVLAGSASFYSTVMAMRHAYLLLFVFALSSCAPRAMELPTRHRCHPKESFYVLGHGWHAGIALNRLDLLDVVPSLREDFPNGEYLEIGWGDAQFYQARTDTAYSAIRAILWPTSTVLHVVAVPKSLRDQFSGSDVMEVSVPRAGYERLLAYVSRSFATTPDRDLLRLGPALYGEGWFYRAEGTFHAFNTCNTWVAKAIGSTGFPLDNRSVITVGALLTQLREGADANPQCYSVR